MQGFFGDFIKILFFNFNIFDWYFALDLSANSQLIIGLLHCKNFKQISGWSKICSSLGYFE